MGRLTLFAIVMAILCVLFLSAPTMAATNSDCDQLIALPAAHQPLMDQPIQLATTSLNLTTITDASSASVVNGQEQKIYTQLIGVNTASPPSDTHSSQTSVVRAMNLGNLLAVAARTDNLLTHPLRC